MKKQTIVKPLENISSQVKLGQSDDIRRSIEGEKIPGLTSSVSLGS